MKRNLKKFSTDSTGLGWEYRIDFTEYLSGVELKTAFEIKLVSKSQFQIAYKSFLAKSNNSPVTFLNSFHM